MQNDVNLTVGPLAGTCGAESVPQADGTTVNYVSHFSNKPFRTDTYIKPHRHHLPADRQPLFGFPNGVPKGQGTPGRLHPRPGAQVLPGAVPAARRPDEPLRHR